MTTTISLSAKRKLELSLMYFEENNICPTIDLLCQRAEVDRKAIYRYKGLHTKYKKLVAKHEGKKGSNRLTAFQIQVSVDSVLEQLIDKREPFSIAQVVRRVGIGRSTMDSRYPELYKRIKDASIASGHITGRYKGTDEIPIKPKKTRKPRADDVYYLLGQYPKGLTLSQMAFRLDINLLHQSEIDYSGMGAVNQFLAKALKELREKDLIIVDEYPGNVFWNVYCVK